MCRGNAGPSSRRRGVVSRETCKVRVGLATAVLPICAAATPQLAAGGQIELVQCLYSIPTIVGTHGDDVLLGTPRDDVIVGLAGDGPGTDRLDGGDGRDRGDGGDGRDRCLNAELRTRCQ